MALATSSWICSLLSCHSQKTLISWQTTRMAPMVSSSRWRMVQVSVANRAMVYSVSMLLASI
ncbi:hypothetical protein [Klebsiella pneumoniae IS10]|nr:hypothetical protein [Klebsiella pneumoniae IS10]CDL63456.1 hypothetical protein [Klebsiella pneumoniae IS39]